MASAAERWAEKEQQLRDILQVMHHFSPAIPDGVAAHLLSKGGCDCPDERTLRLASAAAQNLVLQIAVDAWDYRKLRMERRPDEAAPKMLDRESIVLSLRELGIDAQLCDALRADPLPEPE